MVGEQTSHLLLGDSWRARVLLYLGEGISLGAGTVYGLLSLQSINSVAMNLESVSSLALALVMLFFLVRAIVFIRVGGSGSPDPSTAYQDWKTVRQWRWVGAIGVATSALLIGISLALWGAGTASFYQNGEFFVAGVLFVGFGVYLYALHWIGIRVP